MITPDTLFTVCNQVESTRDRNSAAPLLSSSHQSAEPMNTPATNAVAVWL